MDKHAGSSYCLGLLHPNDRLCLWVILDTLSGYASLFKGYVGGKIGITQYAVELFTFGSEQPCLQYTAAAAERLILGWDREERGLAGWEIGLCTMEGCLPSPQSVI